MFYIGLTACGHLITENEFIQESRQSFELKFLNCNVGKVFSEITVVRLKRKQDAHTEFLMRLRLHNDHWLSTCRARGNRLSQRVDVRRGRGRKDLLKIVVEIVGSILILLDEFADPILAHGIGRLGTRRQSSK